jgi:hypothetical protein
MCRQALTPGIVGMTQSWLPKNGMRSKPIAAMTWLPMPSWKSRIHCHRASDLLAR